MDYFALKLIETTADKALEKWQELKAGGKGSPVVLAGEDWSRIYDHLLAPRGSDGPHIPSLPSVEEILAAADSVRFPADFAKRKTHPPIGEWPASPNPSMGLSVASSVIPGWPLPKTYVGLVPTDDWTTIPAYLRWGGWNDCPAPEYHVAAMRNWRDRYGAELVGMSSDTINLRVATKPKSREEALVLAHEQYSYCTDLIDQGVETYSALAADLMANDWWFFWWD